MRPVGAGRTRLRAALGAVAVGLRGTVTAVAVVAVVAFATMVVAPRLLGLETRTVVSGSMQPTIPTGSAIFVSPTGDQGVQVGDVVLFRVPDRAEDIVHRVVAVTRTDDGVTYRTRGDANQQDDPWALPPADVLGVVRGHVPVIGYAVPLVTSRLLGTILLAVPGIAIVVLELPIWYRFVRYGAAAFEPEDAAGRAWSGRAMPRARSGEGAA